MREAIQLAEAGMNANEGGPFGCVIVKNGIIIGRGNNQVLQTNDPTAHAEIVAIRHACQHLNSFQLDDCILYTSCEPCPMCLGAIYWARPKSVFYACTKSQAAAIGFDDQFIYNEIDMPLPSRKIPMCQMLEQEGLHVFNLWDKKIDKLNY
jgi:tRNA(Arg) A34 adenosine deaminase TadA